MTAPTLARELDDTGHEEGVKAFVASVIALIRTQAAAISGNVLVVLPVCLLVLFAGNVMHANLISPEKAHATLHSFSLLGPTPLYAALTGVAAGASSLLAGWADNWFVLHRVGDALTYNRCASRSVRPVPRSSRTSAGRTWPAWSRTSAGLMLGLVPAIVTVFMFPFEVRHVTLSAGSIGIALGVLGKARHARAVVPAPACSAWRSSTCS